MALESDLSGNMVVSDHELDAIARLLGDEIERSLAESLRFWTFLIAAGRTSLGHVYPPLLIAVYIFKPSPNVFLDWGVRHGFPFVACH